MYVLLEVTVSTIVIGIVFVSTNLLKSSASTNFFIPFMILPAAMSYCYGFMVFSFSSMQTMNAIVLFFTLVGFIPGYLIMILTQVIDMGSFASYLYGFLQIIAPGMGSSVAFSGLTKVAMKLTT